MTTPLDLEELKRLLAKAKSKSSDAPDPFAWMAFNCAVCAAAPAMIAEIERLRAEDEALRRVVNRAIAWKARMAPDDHLFAFSEDEEFDLKEAVSEYEAAIAQEKKP